MSLILKRDTSAFYAVFYDRRGEKKLARFLQNEALASELFRLRPVMTALLLVLTPRTMQALVTSKIRKWKKITVEEATPLPICISNQGIEDKFCKWLKTMLAK